MGAFLNVKINTADLMDEQFKKDILAKGEAIQKQTEELEMEILEIVESKL